jgi:hypothetical protein
MPTDMFIGFVVPISNCNPHIYVCVCVCIYQEECGRNWSWSILRLCPGIQLEEVLKLTSEQRSVVGQLHDDSRCAAAPLHTARCWCTAEDGNEPEAPSPHCNNRPQKLKS